MRKKTGSLAKKSDRTLRKLRRALPAICAIIVVLAIAFGIYVYVYYHAGDVAMGCIENSPDIPLKLTTDILKRVGEEN